MQLLKQDNLMYVCIISIYLSSLLSSYKPNRPKQNRPYIQRDGMSKLRSGRPTDRQTNKDALLIGADICTY